MSMCWPRPLVDAAEQRGVDRRHRMDAGVHVAQRDAQQRRRLARRADHLHDAALGLGDQAEAGAVRIGAGVAIGRDRAVDELRVARRQLGIAQAQLVERAGPVVLDEHVGRVAQPVHEVLAARVLHVDATPCLPMFSCRK